MLLPDFKRVLVIGDSCEDIYHYGTCDRLSPEAPVPVLKLKRLESKPGMCLNVAKNLEGLGIAVKVITQKKAIKKHRFIDDKHHVHLLRVDEDPDDLDEICIQDVRDELEKTTYDAVVISDYNKGFISQSLAAQLVKSLGNNLTFVDSKKHDLRPYSDCIIKVNQKEKDAIKNLPENYELIVTLGEDGASWRDRKYPTKKTQMHDVCGAGDTFIAGLVYMYLQTSSFEDAITFANRCASMSVSHFGNFVIDRSLL